MSKAKSKKSCTPHQLFFLHIFLLSFALFTVHADSEAYAAQGGSFLPTFYYYLITSRKLESVIADTIDSEMAVEVRQLRLPSLIL